MARAASLTYGSVHDIGVLSNMIYREVMYPPSGETTVTFSYIRSKIKIQTFGVPLPSGYFIVGDGCYPALKYLWPSSHHTEN